MLKKKKIILISNYLSKCKSILLTHILEVSSRLLILFKKKNNLLNTAFVKARFLKWLLGGRRKYSFLLNNLVLFF